MGRLSLQAVAVCLILHIASAAILGDGTRSLYTGSPINEIAGGRGSCTVDGRTYASETSIPRSHPCHYCICFRGAISCYWKTCSAAPEGCSIMFFEDKCNPSLYKCTVPKMTMAEPVFGARISPLKRRFGRSVDESPMGMPLPVREPFPVDLTDPSFLTHLSRSKRAIGLMDKGTSVFWQPKDKSCTILGVKYGLGDVIGVATDPCMECRCAAGDLFCSPRCCFNPAPLAVNRLQIIQHEEALKRQGHSVPPHPLYNIRNQQPRANRLR